MICLAEVCDSLREVEGLGGSDWNFGLALMGEVVIPLGFYRFGGEFVCVFVFMVIMYMYVRCML